MEQHSAPSMTDYNCTLSVTGVLILNKKHSQAPYLGQSLGLCKAQDKNGFKTLNVPLLTYKFSACRSHGFSLSNLK